VARPTSALARDRGIGNVAGSTVAIPVLAYAGAGNRLDDPMARLKDWMERNNAALLAAILVVIGLMVLYNGIHPLLKHA